MTDFWRDLLLLLSAVNPAAVAVATRGTLPTGRAGAIGTATVLALAIYLLATTTASHFLDLLDISPESFRLGAALVMAPIGAYAIIRASVPAAPPEDSGWRAGIFPLGIPLLAAPAALAGAISASADHGAGYGFAAAAIAVIAGALATAGSERVPHVAADAVARLLGALLVIMAVALFVEGVQAV